MGRLVRGTCASLKNNGDPCGSKYVDRETSLCDAHKTPRCVADKVDGTRCRNRSDKLVYGLCHAHQDSAKSPYCEGEKEGRPCKALAKLGYDYCCANHDPSKNYRPSDDFKPEFSVRSRFKNAVVARDGEVDRYHGDMMELTKKPRNYHMDHIGECQFGSYTVHRMTDADPDDQEYVVKYFKDELLNKSSNLCFTRATTNELKGAAVFKYLDDKATGHLNPHATFTSYMIKETANYKDYNNSKRDTTRVISQNMGDVIRSWQYKCEDESETPILGRLDLELQGLFAAMELCTSESL